MMVSSLGTTKFGLPASLRNLFWGVLYWKQQAENELIRSGMLYTIVRPGGMEKPTDSYKDTHNTVLYARDKMFGGQVSRLQVCAQSFSAHNYTCPGVPDSTVARSNFYLKHHILSVDLQRVNVPVSLDSLHKLPNPTVYYAQGAYSASATGS